MAGLRQETLPPALSRVLTPTELPTAPQGLMKPQHHPGVDAMRPTGRNGVLEVGCFGYSEATHTSVHLTLI